MGRIVRGGVGRRSGETTRVRRLSSARSPRGGGGAVRSLRLRRGRRGEILIDQDGVDDAGGYALGETCGDVLNEEGGARLAKHLGKGRERLRIETFARGEHLDDA